MAIYRIRITKYETVVKTTKEYQRIADTGNERDGKTVYDYIPVEKETDVERDVLDCTVANLDLQNVSIHIPITFIFLKSFFTIRRR